MVTFSLQGEKPVVTPSSYSRSTQEEIIIMLQITTNRLIQTQSKKKERERQEFFNHLLFLEEPYYISYAKLPSVSLRKVMP